MIITGAGGFIGSVLVEYFVQKNWQVIAFVQAIPDKPVSGAVYVKYDLQQEPDEGAFADTDALIHCAYVKNDIEKNVSGTKKLLMMCRKHHVERTVFLSSFSAHPDAVSKYGKQKLEIEKLFNTKSDCSVRAGVVLGNGGIFKQMSGHILKGKRIPLFDGGTQPMQTIHVNDLAMIIDRIIDQRISGIYTLAEPVPIPYKEFFIALSEKLGKKAKFIRVPFGLVNFGLMMAEWLRIKLPINRENVLGLKFIRQRETKADLEKLGVKIRNFKESLKDL